jgi:hypothetical protein
MRIYGPAGYCFPFVPGLNTLGRSYLPAATVVLHAEANLRLVLCLVVLAIVTTCVTHGFAQKLVDPNTVPPEYRAAAEKRRAEQIRQVDCAHKADVEKVLPRERTAFLIHCIETVAGK